jgi:hypothetical protein
VPITSVRNDVNVSTPRPDQELAYGRYSKERTIERNLVEAIGVASLVLREDPVMAIVLVIGHIGLLLLLILRRMRKMGSSVSGV